MCGNWSFGVWHDGWPHPVVWTAGQYLPPFRCESEKTMSKSKKTDMPGMAGAMMFPACSPAWGSHPRTMVIVIFRGSACAR